MAKYGSDKVGFVLIDGYDVLGVTTRLEDEVEALLDETTALGDSWQSQKYVGLRQVTLTQEGFFDDASNSAHDALGGKSGESRVLCYNLTGNTIGQEFTGHAGALQTNYSVVASRGELHRANASYQGAGEVEEGLILHPHTARTADGDTKSTPVQHGSSSTNGGTAYLQVSDLTLGDYTNAVIRVLERNGATWDTLTTFTAVTTSPIAERVTVAGTVEQDLAVEWEFTGTGSDPSITFAVGFVRN